MRPPTNKQKTNRIHVEYTKPGFYFTRERTHTDGVGELI